MPEVDLGFPRQWVEFANPADASEVFRCDLTWLTSRWTCIFGAGCPGIFSTQPRGGLLHARRPLRGRGRPPARGRRPSSGSPPNAGSGTIKVSRAGPRSDDEDELKTRIVDGACIFHNSRDFAGGYGCALHGLALAEGVEPLTLKPDVCWQLPIRRQFREVDPGDGSTYTEVQIGEYTRAGWGPGGADLDWYCSSNTEAHVGMEPVYVANRAELEELMGADGYAELSRHCEAFEDAGVPTPHPAS